MLSHEYMTDVVGPHLVFLYNKHSIHKAMIDFLQDLIILDQIILVKDSADHYLMETIQWEGRFLE